MLTVPAVPLIIWSAFRYRQCCGASCRDHVPPAACNRCLRLIREREAEIEAFVSDEYWSVEAELGKADGRNFIARLTHLDSEKLEKLSIGGEDKALAAVAKIDSCALFVKDIETKRVRRNPSIPLHHLDIATGGVPQTWFFSKPDHADCPEAL